MAGPLRGAAARVRCPRSPDTRRALRRDYRPELPRRAHQEAAHRTPRPRRYRRVGGKATTVMSGIRSRCHTGSIWATPSGSRWATVDTAFKRRTEEVGRLLPELYLHGLAQGDFDLALRGLLGDGAPLSATSSGAGWRRRRW